MVFNKRSRKRKRLKSPDELRGELRMSEMDISKRFRPISGPGLVKVKPVAFKTGRVKL